MKALKVGAVVLSAIVLTTFAIDASDTFRGQSGTLVASLIRVEDESACPEGMVSVLTAKTYSCVDAYEASAESGCPFVEVNEALANIANLASSDCRSTSVSGATPWRYIAREQAALVCARSGKRLPTAAEWYESAIGTPDDARCAVDELAAQKTGAKNECRSAVGVHDGVGNVWEWVSDDVFQGVYRERALPPEGYVTQVASDGVATETGVELAEQFGEDYLWSDAVGSYGMIRGGFYGSKEDAGVFAVHAKTPPTTIGAGIGFRCVR